MEINDGKETLPCPSSCSPWTMPRSQKSHAPRTGMDTAATGREYSGGGRRSPALWQRRQRGRFLPHLSLGLGLRLLVQPLPIGETGVASRKQQTRKMVCLFGPACASFQSLRAGS